MGKKEEKRLNVLTWKRKKEKAMRQKSEGGDGNEKEAMQRTESGRCERQHKDVTQRLSRCDKETNLKLMRKIGGNDERDVRRRGESDQTEDKVKDVRGDRVMANENVLAEKEKKMRRNEAEIRRRPE